MRSGFDIIMLALPRWDGPYSSTAYSLAKELSTFARVFYVDNPYTLVEYIRKRDQPELRRRKNALFYGTDFFTCPELDYPDLFAVTPRLMAPVNFLPEGKLYNWFSKMNDRILSGTLNHLMRIFGIRKYVLINSFNPVVGNHLTLSLKPVLTVYQSVDDISQAPHLARHGLRLENEMIRKADFTIVTSSELKRAKSVYSPQVHLLPNAANTALFQQAVRNSLERPEELRDIPENKKIICYTGNICQRLDYALLMKVAAYHSDKILLMVGPLTRKDYETSGLSRLPNVIFAGPKKIEELPAYLKYSDCCVIPFLCNRLTKSVYPLKINEYLSAGKPVVTTEFSDDITGFSQVAYVASGHDAFIRLISQALEEDSPMRSVERISFSSANNWRARARHFMEFTVEFLKQHDGGTGKPERRKRAAAVYG